MFSDKEFSLKPYQEETVEFCLKNKYSIVALDPGLGKTLVALVVAKKLGARTLVIVPSFLIFNWINEIKKFFPEMVVSVFDSSKRIYPPVDSDIVLTTPDLVQRNEEIYNYVFEWAELVIVDEATCYKTMEAKRTDSFHRLIYENSVKRCMQLTGTPIQNRVYELYSLVAICNYNPEIIESTFLNKFPTYIDFADYFSHRVERYVTTKRGRKLVPQWEGKKNISELKSKYLKNIYIRFKSEDVLDLPEELPKDVYMSDIDCGELLEAFEAYNEENSSVSPKIKKEVALKKVEFTAKYVLEELDRFGSAIVYTDHVEACEELAKKFKVQPIHGGTPVEKRAEIFRKFINGETQVLVATIMSFNTGITATNCNFMVFNDLNWVPGNLEQARRRIRRIGQTKKCHYHYILGSKQDKYILESLEAKEEVIKAVT